MSKKMILVGGLAALTLAGAAGASLAQAPQGFEGRRGPPPAEGRGGPEQRAEALRTQLSITPAQENAFQAYLSATGRPPRGDGPRGRQALPGATAPQRIDAQLAQAAERQADLRARADATKRFYSALTPDQRAAFDRLPPQVMLGLGAGGGGRMAMAGPRGERRGPGSRGFGAPQGYRPQ